MIKSSGFFIRGKGGRMSSILLDCYGMNLDGTFFTSTVLNLEFSMNLLGK